MEVSGLDPASRAVYEEAALVLVAVSAPRNLLTICHALQVGAAKLDATTAGAQVLHSVHERCYVEIRRI